MKRSLFKIALVSLSALQFVASTASKAADEAPFSIKLTGHTFLTDAGNYSAVFGKDPVISVTMDREYGVLTLWIKGMKDPAGYVLNPQDGQSAVSVMIGEPRFLQSDAALANAPGFTEIRRKEATVAGEKNVWREWSDAHHLYGDTLVNLTPDYGPGAKKIRVYLNITANSPERRQALEDHLASIRMIDSGAADGKMTPVRNLQQRLEINDSEWSLVQKNDQELRWITKDAEEITLLIRPGNKYMPDPSKRAEFQNRFRDEAKQLHGGIVEADTFESSGVVCGLVTMKFPLKNLGWAYQTTAIIATHQASYLLRVKAMESGTTGTRESLVTIIDMKQRGVSDLRVESAGFRKDPYDSKYDGDACFMVSDERRWDKSFPKHPLTRCRKIMASLTKSWSIGEEFRRDALYRSLKGPGQ